MPTGAVFSSQFICTLGSLFEPLIPICMCLINHRGSSEWAETFNEGARHV